MPELPEVEYARSIAENVAVGRLITEVHCGDDPIVFEGVGEKAWHQALIGASVLSAHRHGKHLWLALSRKPWPVFHFGMTGYFKSPETHSLELSSTPAGGEPEQWPPRFCKLRLVFDDGGQLAMINKRRLGRLRLRDAPRTDLPIGKLGFDVLNEAPTAEQFFEVLTSRRAVVKSLLLNQKFAAGIGNWIADEILYHARIDPRRHAHTLNRQESDALLSSLLKVVGLAVSVDADKKRFPDDWLFHQRWGRTEGQVTAEGDPIHFCTLGGRSTAWVPARQS